MLNLSRVNTKSNMGAIGSPEGLQLLEHDANGLNGKKRLNFNGEQHLFSSVWLLLLFLIYGSNPLKSKYYVSFADDNPESLGAELLSAGKLRTQTLMGSRDPSRGEGRAPYLLYPEKGWEGPAFSDPVLPSV